MKLNEISFSFSPLADVNLAEEITIPKGISIVTHMVTSFFFFFLFLIHSI